MRAVVKDTRSLCGVCRARVESEAGPDAGRDLLAACVSALNYIHADVMDESDEAREGPASKLHDKLLAAIVMAGGRIDQ